MKSAEFTNEALSELQLRPVERSEETRYQEQMARHHYLGELPKIGETAWYVATWREQWVAQLSISAAALKCGVRDRWIGWDFRSQYGRLKLIANNSRFLILPEWHRSNIGSRVLSLTERRVGADCGQRLISDLRMQLGKQGRVIEQREFLLCSQRLGAAGECALRVAHALAAEFRRLLCMHCAGRANERIDDGIGHRGGKVGQGLRIFQEFPHTPYFTRRLRFLRYRENARPLRAAAQ